MGKVKKSSNYKYPISTWTQWQFTVYTVAVMDALQLSQYTNNTKTFSEFQLQFPHLRSTHIKRDTTQGEGRISR
jgi:hypothetical protein